AEFRVLHRGYATRWAHARERARSKTYCRLLKENSDGARKLAMAGKETRSQMQRRGDSALPDRARQPLGIPPMHALRTFLHSFAFRYARLRPNPAAPANTKASAIPRGT